MTTLTFNRSLYFGRITSTKFLADLNQSIIQTKLIFATSGTTMLKITYLCRMANTWRKSSNLKQATLEWVINMATRLWISCHNFPNPASNFCLIYCSLIFCSKSLSNKKKELKKIQFFFHKIGLVFSNLWFYIGLNYAIERLDYNFAKWTTKFGIIVTNKRSIYYLRLAGIIGHRVFSIQKYYRQECDCV